MLKSCFKHIISIYIIIFRDNCILVAIKVRLDCCKFIRRISYYWNNHQISSFQFQEFLESQLVPIYSCTTSRHRQEENRETRFPWHGIARIVERWRGSRVESRDGCRAYLSSNTAKYFRESGLRALHYVGKLSCTPMYRSTRESAYRKGAAYRPLFATPSCTFKLQGQAVYIGATQSFSLALFFFFFPFFAFLSFTFVNSFRNPVLGSWIEMNGFFGNWFELERNARRINILILANIVKIAITTD